MQDDETARTRDRVLFGLKTRGPQTAGQLAEQLGVTSMAVRQHLASLEDEELVGFDDQRQRVGRPARVWRLTARASERFPDRHSDLTVDLLQSLREAYGEEGVDRLVSLRTRRQLEVYRSKLPGTDRPLRERVRRLAKLRSEEGYMAECKSERNGTFLLLENHCPICAAASLCQGLCRDELQLFRDALGDDVTVERTEHILAGARRCAYRVRPNA